MTPTRIMMREYNILIAQRDKDVRSKLMHVLQSAPCRIFDLKRGEEALAVVTKKKIDALIADTKFPGFDGLSLLEEIKKINPHMLVFITGEASVETAVRAIKLGANDYFTTPLNWDDLQKRIYHVLSQSSAVEDVCSPENKLPEMPRYCNIIGKSDQMKKVYQLIDKIASSDSTVLILGESGTGKELVARAIHVKSNRSHKPLIPVNCGAIPEELLESELFGHEKGAFTSAYKSRVGRFELANGGSIFLDEIGDMSPNLQVKILRVLQEHEFERVGGVRPVAADIRVIAATHRDLDNAVKEGTFREDLFYRLNVIPIIIPPLRERKSDIPELITYFTAFYNKKKNTAISGFSDEALRCLIEYQWPGNVRELQNLIERLVILKDQGIIDIDDLPPKFSSGTTCDELHMTAEINDVSSFTTMVSNFEKRLILQALTKSSGVKNKAAKLLNMNRTTLVEKMKKLKINHTE